MLQSSKIQGYCLSYLLFSISMEGRQPVASIGVLIGIPGFISSEKGLIAQGRGYRFYYYEEDTSKNVSCRAVLGASTPGAVFYNGFQKEYPEGLKYIKNYRMIKSTQVLNTPIQSISSQFV